MAYKKGDSLIRKNPLFILASHLTFYTVIPIAWFIFYGLYRGKIRGRWRIKDFLKENKNEKKEKSENKLYSRIFGQKKSRRQDLNLRPLHP